MKINYDRPKVNSFSINQKKDFNTLNQLHLASSLPFYKKRWFIGSSIFITIIVLTIIVFNKRQTIVPFENSAQKITKTTNLMLNKLDTQIAYLEDTPCITPPSSQLTLPFQTYRILPNKVQTISLDNAKLTVPANSFLDSNNNILKDSIILKIKIMNDPIDFILSGIPMEYDSAGLTYTFESGGMFEIMGTDLNNNPISINKEKPLVIHFGANENSENFNFYTLDTIKKKWSYISNNTLNKKVIPFEADKTHNFDNANWKEGYREQNIANQKWQRAEKDVVTYKKTEPNAPTKVKDIKQTFTLDINKNQFPELGSFTKQKFEPVKPNKTTSHIYSTEWTSIKLREHKKGISYLIILKNETKMETLIAQPVYEGKDWAKAQHLYSNKYAKYLAILEQKEEKALELKTDYEKKKKHFDQIDKLKKTTKDIIQSVSITLTAPIINFGIFNFDHPIISRPKSITPPLNRIEVKTKEQPIFTDINGQELDFEKIYIIESKRNASFSYNLEKNNYFSYNEKSAISIIGFNENKDLVLINNKNFKESINTNSPFIGEAMPNTTIAELKRLILKI